MPSSSSLDQQTFVVVDLETTGGSAVYDRIVEVAAVRVRGGEVLDRFETLVAPGVPLPPFITRLTGITPALLRGRPLLDSVLPDLERFIGDAVVVAHNASFDYAFLQNAFTRAQIAWAPERLCTLRLSRRLLPGLHSYKLDSLCAHLGFSYVQRHRAGPDADVTVSLLQHLVETAHEQGMVTLDDLLRFQQAPVGGKKRKGKVDEAQVASLPTGPGVYLLKDDRGHVMYVGKSVNVRSRVRQHLRPSGTAASPGQPRLRKRLPYIADIEAIETGSELEALFLESKLVKRYLPDANRLLRDYRDYPFIKLDLSDAYPRLVATRERPADDGLYFGPFRKASMVASAVQFLTEQLGLRQCKGPLGHSACPLLELGKCLGPCVGAVSQTEYGAAVSEAERILRGEERGLLDRAAERRDQLAEELRFEEAAELRDRLRALEHVVGVQQRLQAFAERNLVIVTSDVKHDAARLFVVREGRLVDEQTVPVSAPPAMLRGVLRTSFVTAPRSSVTRDDLDDMLILDSWLKHRADATREIPIPTEQPESAAPALRSALSTLYTAQAA